MRFGADPDYGSARSKGGTRPPAAVSNTALLLALPFTEGVPRRLSRTFAPV